MILKLVKLEGSVFFSNASVVSLIFAPKTLIWNKMVLPASNSLNLLLLVEHELKKIFSKKT